MGPELDVMASAGWNFVAISVCMPNAHLSARQLASLSWQTVRGDHAYILCNYAILGVAAELLAGRKRKGYKFSLHDALPNYVLPLINNYVVSAVGCRIILLCSVFSQCMPSFPVSSEPLKRYLMGCHTICANEPLAGHMLYCSYNDAGISSQIPSVCPMLISRHDSSHPWAGRRWKERIYGSQLCSFFFLLNKGDY